MFRGDSDDDPFAPDAFRRFLGHVERLLTTGDQDEEELLRSEEVAVGGDRERLVAPREVALRSWGGKPCGTAPKRGAEGVSLQRSLVWGRRLHAWAIWG